MSSNDLAVSVCGVSKRYELYESPKDHLKQLVIPKLRKLAGLSTRNYFQEYWALSNVNFEVRKGESVGIVGRNGSGKSTLLQIITGTLAPTQGTVETHGRIAALLELGSGFNPEFTGRENVYLNCALLGFDSRQVDEIFDDIASFADIGNYIDQPVKTYSSGMMLRLAFAVQVQIRPDILIVDEALAVGDALFQKRCFQKIESLSNDGVTLLFVSHDQESVRTLTNRALLLNKGEVKAWGKSSEVVLEYRRLLHGEESKYFSDLANKLSSKAVASLSEVHANPDNNAKIDGEVSGVTMRSTLERSVQLSFGDEEARILEVIVTNEFGQPSSVFYPGDKINIRVAVQSRVDTDKLNIAIRIRNKEGVKVYSWGTLNQDMKNAHLRIGAPLFWQKRVDAGENFSVNFHFECVLGVNLYEVQASVSYEETPDYMSQRILHWVDEAAFFQVLVDREKYFFGGLTDLKMSATW